jgi:thioredoxin reductase (NADPH)
MFNVVFIGPECQISRLAPLVGLFLIGECNVAVAALGRVSGADDTIVIVVNAKPSPTSPPDSRPVILAVDDHAESLGRIVANLDRRYRADYDVIGEIGPKAALARLEALRDAGADVALIAASQDMTAETGTAFLAKTRPLYPTARRLAMANFFALDSMPPIARASTLGEIDAYADEPWTTSDERFLATIGETLADWAREHGRIPPAMTVIGEGDDPEARLLTNVLQSWDVPHAFVRAETPEGRAYVREHELGGRLPAVELPGGRIATNATLASVVDLFDVQQEPSSVYDVAVVGLGPAGFSAAMNAASEGLRVMMIESAFSQSSSSPMIRNYLGFPTGLRGADLQRRAWIQATLFGAEHRIGRSVRGLRHAGDELELVLDDDSTVRTRAVVLSTGVKYRRIDVPSVERLVGRGVFYTYGSIEAQALEGQPAAVVGGGNSAAQAAAHLARYASRVVMLVRSELSGSVSDYLIEQLNGLPNVEIRLNTEVVAAGDAHQLRRITVRSRADGSESELEVAGMFVMIGSVPRTDWLPDEVARDRKGFVLTGPEAGGGSRLAFETAMPGVFAAGDVRSGSVKRVAAAVGEGAQAIQQLHQYRATAAGEPVAAGAR